MNEMISSITSVASHLHRRRFSERSFSSCSFSERSDVSSLSFAINAKHPLLSWRTAMQPDGIAAGGSMSSYQFSQGAENTGLILP